MKPFCLGIIVGIGLTFPAFGQGVGQQHKFRSYQTG
jgi:hypothetical protein